jgi:RimJ/RimL family protein N-acetyltransferase
MSAWTEVPVLRGAHVALAPLRAEHADGIRAALDGDALARLWYTNVPAVAQVDGYLDNALRQYAAGKELPFAVFDAGGALSGVTRFYDLTPDVPRLSIGYTWYAPRVQRTGVNTETKLLLLEYAFETLGCIAVYLETSWFNHASRAAIARLGAKQDGVLRHHKRHTDGTVRDTVLFSILDHEWPAVKLNLQHRLERHADAGAGHD